LLLVAKVLTRGIQEQILARNHRTPILTGEYWREKHGQLTSSSTKESSMTAFHNSPSKGY
jgi:hypothetical protein